MVSETSSSLPRELALSRAYASVFLSTLKLRRVSPPKNVRWAVGRAPDWSNMKSTLLRAVSSLM